MANASRLIDQQVLNLPHTNEGNIDFRTLGNMISASLLGEVVYANVVDHEHSSEGTDIQHESYGWQFYYKESDIVILRKRLPYTKACCFMGRGVIDVPLEHVAKYIHKFQNRLEWDDTLLQMEVCQQFSEDDWLLYMAHEAKQCFFTSRRDFLYYCRTGYIDGKYVHSVLSIEDKEYPHRPPYIRGEIKAGTGWVVEKYNNSECQSLVTYAAHLDLKELPTVIVNRVLRRQPMSIKYIRQKLTKPKVPLSYMISSSPSNSPRFVSTRSSNASENRFYEEYTSMEEFIPPKDIDLTGSNIADKRNNKKVTIEISSSFSSYEQDPQSYSSQLSSSHTSNPSSHHFRQRAYTNSLPDLQYRPESPLSLLSEPVTLTKQKISETVPVPACDSRNLLIFEADNTSQEFPALSSWNDGVKTDMAEVEPTV